MIDFRSLDWSGIYPDLIRKFLSYGHEVTVISPRERRSGLSTSLKTVDGVDILGVRTLNLKKTNLIEKGIGQILIESQFTRAYKKYLNDRHFDLVIYSTPPITFPKTIKYIKSVNPGAISYLLLKDIFPQNAIDLGMMSKSGVKGLLYRFFRRKEKRMYTFSDFIGCMSPANVQYVISHNLEVNPSKVELAPNSIELKNETINDRNEVLSKYDLPLDIPIFIYGGNLGKPQGIPYLIKSLDLCSDRNDCFFVVVGDGTEYHLIEQWIKAKSPLNVRLIKRLSKADYDVLVAACNVGLICLDSRFTIPNYPSRLLSYLEHKMPVICATDVNSDIGPIAEANGYGYWCESVKPEDFVACVDKMLASDITSMGENGYQYLCQHYLVENTAYPIMKHFE